MTDKERKEHNKKIKKLQEDYPSIPTEVYDIEASSEMAEMYLDEFGY